ncbi:MAG: RHS repeat-associated core domain-containing protein, partial [Sulfurovum sp.]|nr:RHS repeat-associated core domain-containing protein [Sulfurovum sp.]
YTGRETDQEDLYYYRARYYDPTTQRFLSRDPIEFEAGDFNFYRYVGNDPVNYVDPSGLFLLQAGGALIGAVAGGAFEGYNQWKSGKLNVGRLLMASGSGAVAGLATSVGGAMALGALGGALNNTYQQLDGSNPCKKFDLTDVVENAIGGIVGAKLGDVIGNFGKNILRNPIEREVRRIIPGAFPSGANYGNTGAVIGAAAGEAAGSQTSNTIDTITDNYIDLGEIIVTPDDCSKPCP